MVTLVKGLTNAEAWLRAVRKLDRLAGRTAYGLIIEVDRPLAGPQLFLTRTASPPVGVMP